jgi:hypothetical protein
MERAEAHALAVQVVELLAKDSAWRRLRGVDVSETLTGARIKIIVHLSPRPSKEIGDPPPHVFTPGDLGLEEHNVIDDVRHPL